MKSDVRSLRGEMAWLTGHTYPKRAAAGNRARLALLPVIVIAGFAAWAMLSGPSDAQSQPEAAVSQDMLSTPATPSWFDPVITPTQVTLTTPPAATAPAEMALVETSPLDRLKISSQSWRRGGLGSNALVTFTLRNGNGYAVRDIEISCVFTRRDGSHLTDRTRMIHDTVNMRSRRTFARLHVGFVNVNAEKAKCSLVTANRL